MITDTNGASVLDATIPGGPYDAVNRIGWSANGSGTTFSYRNSSRTIPAIEGIYRVIVKQSAGAPGLVRFSVSGKGGSYAVAPADLPLTATFILDPPYAATNQCGEATFPASCSYVESGAVKCQ